MMKVTTLSLCFCFAFIVGILYQHFEGEIYDQLKSEAIYLSVAVEETGIDILNSVDSDQRITLIDLEGNVIFDNCAVKSEMDNHIGREEVEEALNIGIGKSQRYSNTLHTKTLYYAIKLNNGYVLRIADNQDTIINLVFRMIQPVLIIFVFTLCLAWFIAKKLTHLILAPINELDLEEDELNIEYQELDPLVTHIRQLRFSLKAQMDQAIEHQTEFKIITNHMNEGLIMIGQDLDILMYNESIRKHLNINKDIQGESVYILNHDISFIRFIERTMKNGHDEWVQEINGRYFQWISNRIDSNDNVGGAVIIVIDVTEKIKRDHFRRDFSANVSHELKTPLTSISGFAEIIQNGIARDEDVKSFAGDIYKESQRLIELVNDIIRLSQLGEHAIVYQKESINVKKEIDSIIEILSPIANKKQVTIDVSGEDIEIDTVPSIFHEIIFNLVDNAIKYNKENGRVDIEFYKDGNHFEITVKDTGIGIPIQDQERIFERFYRVDKSRAGKYGGTGLGLSIVKHGVSSLNGTISLKSTLNQGTDISVSIPIE